LISHDFDFQIGQWHVKHRRLKERLVASTDWEEFSGTSEMRPILGGNGNVEDNLLNISSGAYRAVALRSFDPVKKRWAIWWLDGRAPHVLDVPVIGKFENGTGSFYADVTQDGIKAQLRFLWLTANKSKPRWEQAMSIDNGKTWETNWTMDFTRE